MPPSFRVGALLEVGAQEGSIVRAGRQGCALRCSAFSWANSGITATPRRTQKQVDLTSPFWQGAVVPIVVAFLQFPFDR
jgi:hypothetical protein